MFYDDYCKTDSEKAIFKAIMELSKDSKYIAIQELDNLGIDRAEIETILSKFAKYGLFQSVQRLSQNHPVFFMVKR